MSVYSIVNADPGLWLLVLGHPMDLSTLSTVGLLDRNNYNVTSVKQIRSVVFAQSYKCKQRHRQKWKLNDGTVITSMYSVNGLHTSEVFKILYCTLLFNLFHCLSVRTVEWAIWSRLGCKNPLFCNPHKINLWRIFGSNFRKVDQLNTNIKRGSYCCTFTFISRFMEQHSGNPHTPHIWPFNEQMFLYSSTKL